MNSDYEQRLEESRRINEALKAGPLREELDRRAAAEGRRPLSTEEVLAELDKLTEEQR